MAQYPFRSFFLLLGLSLLDALPIFAAEMSWEEQALVAAIRDNLDDDTPRLVYADWLQEHDQPARAEFIRLQIKRWRTPEAMLPEESEKLSNLFERHGIAWTAEFTEEFRSRRPQGQEHTRLTPPYYRLSNVIFVRGFPYSVNITPDGIEAPHALARLPSLGTIQEVRMPYLATVLGSHLMRKIRSLYVQLILNWDFEALRSPALGALLHLHVIPGHGHNMLSDQTTLLELARTRESLKSLQIADANSLLSYREYDELLEALVGALKPSSSLERLGMQSYFATGPDVNERQIWVEQAAWHPSHHGFRRGVVSVSDREALYGMVLEEFHCRSMMELYPESR